MNTMKLNPTNESRYRNLFFNREFNIIGTMKISTVEKMVLILPPIVANGPNTTKQIVDKQYNDNKILKLFSNLTFLELTKSNDATKIPICIIKTGFNNHFP